MVLPKQKAMSKYALFECAFLSLTVVSVGGSVVLIGRNVSLSFPDVEANFAPSIKEFSECGVLYVAEPLDACAPLTNDVAQGKYSPYVLIIRGGCAFDIKVRNAQHAGFKAAIVYDNKERQSLISMAGNSVGIHIYAVFISMASGEMLKEYAGRTDLELWVIPSFEYSTWSIVVLSFVSMLIISAVLATWFFARRHLFSHEQPRLPNIQQFNGMSSQLVKAMPSLIFTSVTEDNCTSTACAICLEDYSVGEKLRVLPCRHKFHTFCVDCWLTTWRTFCPICKQDARAGFANLPPSEFTPLLNSGAATPALLSSLHSSMAASFRSSSAAMAPSSLPNPEPHSLTSTCSPAIQIASLPCRSQSSSCFSDPVPNLHLLYGCSPALSINRSSLGLLNASSHRSFIYAHSFGLPVSSSIYSSQAHSFAPVSSDASSSNLAANSSRQSYSSHSFESGASLSALDSAQYLPEC